ncbi:protein kinase, partial [Mariniblastus sp.]|nr:protein kinase [Mariniblastus sp.]
MPDFDDSLGDDPTYVGRGEEREDQSLGDQSTYAGSNESSLSDLDGLGGSLEDGLAGLEIVDLESRYTIIRPIGKGGMGEVFLATDTRLNRKVAIKRIKDELTTPAAAARFLTEAKSIAALSHPYIVQVYDYGRAKDGPFLIMEYVEGENLQQVCNQGVMALEDAVDLSCKLCDALSAAHSKGIIHRDIKPANILMTSGGWPKISDFGLAKSTNDHGHTMTGTALGTLDFMPPEQRRDASAADHRSDLWSLAATIYQMVTGESPRVIDLDDVPGALRSVLAKALKTKPESRYQSAVELGTALVEGMAAPEQPVVIPMAELGAGECPKCHVKNESSRKFCSGCGESLRVSCMKCEQDIPVWENFCGECGGNQSDLLATRASELVQIRSEAEQLRSDQQYEESIQLAQKLAAVEDDRLLEYKSWADDFLRSTEELWEREKQSAQRHLEESKKHRKVFDYSAAINAIEAIPEPLLSAEIKSYLLAVESEKRKLATRVAELKQIRSEAEQFRSDQRYEASMQLAQKLAAIEDDRLLEHKSWADDFLRSTEELWAREKQSAQRHLEESKKRELTKLIPIIKERVKNREVDGLLELVDRAIALRGESGNLAKLQQQLIQGKLERIRLQQEWIQSHCKTINGHTSIVHSVAFSPDGNSIASGSRDGTFKIWDAKTGKVKLTLKRHRASVYSVAFSPDGNSIVSGSGDSTLKIWDAKTGKEKLTLKGHTGTVLSVAYSPDGNRIVSGSWDNTIKIWDAKTGEEKLALKGHADHVESVAFSPDGNSIVSGSFDRTIKIWDVTALSS